MMRDDEAQRLAEDGYLVLADFMSPALLEALRSGIEEAFAAEGERAGSEFKAEPQTRRLANLVNRGGLFAEVIALPEILERVGWVLGPDFKLSSLNARSANPRSDWVQPLHCDVGAIPDELGDWVCNVVWMLDDFTTENGAIRVIPGSHRWGRLPQSCLDDPAAPHPDELLLVGRAGTIVVMNAHLWHGATANRTDAPRRALHSFYCRWDKPQQQYQKGLISPAVARSLNPGLRRLLALDDAGNDELSARESGQSGFLK